MMMVGIRTRAWGRRSAVRRMPVIRSGDPIPRGPYTELLPDGTRRHVYAGPNYRPPLNRWRRAFELLTRPGVPLVALLLVAGVAIAWSAGWWLPVVAVVAFSGLSWLTGRWLRQHRD